MTKLPESFYLGDDVIQIARDLLGKKLFSDIEGELTGGIIVETEAYKGPMDRGSHAFNGKRTPRNEIMYSQGGIVYMYICYGIHDMLNIVTGPKNSSHAILIRAIEPTVGLDIMRDRRNLYDHDTRLCQGPGALAKAMGLTKSLNGISLQGNKVWIEHADPIRDENIVAAPRVGMNFDGPYKLILWRFYVRGNKNVSRPNKG